MCSVDSENIESSNINSNILSLDIPANVFAPVTSPF